MCCVPSLTIDELIVRYTRGQKLRGPLEYFEYNMRGDDIAEVATMFLSQIYIASALPLKADMVFHQLHITT